MPDSDNSPETPCPVPATVRAGAHGDSNPSGPFETLQSLAVEVAAALDGTVLFDGGSESASATDSAPSNDRTDTCVSVGLKTGDSRTVAIRLPRGRVPEFLNRLGAATVQARLVDVQFWLQERYDKSSSGLRRVFGAVIDVDLPSVDTLGEVQRAAARMPNFHFSTLNGFKLGYLYSRQATTVEAEAHAKALTLAFRGGDPRSWWLSQGQRLPVCLKGTETGITEVSLPSLPSNAEPLDPSLDALPFPELVRSFISDSRLSPETRSAVEEYLAAIGTPAPESPGSHLYRSCPDATHDSDCCYVRRAETGEVSVVCLGGHGGEGLRRWSESKLAALAGLDERIANSGSDIVTDAPFTWATAKLVEMRLSHLSREERQAALDILLLTKARQEAEREQIPPNHLGLVIANIERRLRGQGHVGPTRLHYSETHGSLALMYRDERVKPFLVKGDTLSPRTHLHQYAQTAGWRVRVTDDGYIAGPTLESQSLFNMALGGHPGALADLGIPILRTFDLPVAHVAEDWQLQMPHRNVHAVVPFRWSSSGVTPVDPVAFFMRLFNQRRLPLASANDVRVFLMAFGSPLLRHIGQGQLGIYWLHGPVGSGKDYLAEMIAKTWERVARAGRQSKFDLSLTDELELKRSFFSGIGAVYARAKEAGKRRGIPDLLIRLAGTDFISARGMRRDEATIPNMFTILADSAEDVPDRREISRRTAMIEVSPIDEEVSKGDVLREVLDNAEGLLAGFMRLIESRPPEWYLSQANLGSRPLIPVALSRLLGAELPVVKGRDLDDVFDAMLEYVTRLAGDEGEKQRRQARAKDGREAQLLRHFRFSAFIETMRKQTGYAETFEGHKASDLLVTWIKRETAYTSVDRGREPYLPVTMGDTRYAFKIVKGRRAFVFLPEAEFCAAIGCQPVSGAAAIPPPPPGEPPAAQSPSAPSVNEPMTFTDDELQGGQP